MHFKMLDVKILGMKESRWLLLVVTLLAPISWGTTYIVTTELLPDGQPLTVAALRVLPASLLLIAVGTARSRWRPRGRAEWRRHALISLFNFSLFFPLLVAATYRMPGGIVAAAGGLQPLFVAVIAYLLFRRPAAPRELLTGLTAAIGVALVVGIGSASFDLLGVVATVIATASFAVSVVLTKRFTPSPDRIAATGWQLGLSSLLLVPVAIAVEGTPTISGGRDLIGLAYLSLVATGLAFIFWFSGIQRLPTHVPPLLGLAAPLTGAAIGWAFLGQSLSLLQVTGFFVTVGAIKFGVRTQRPKLEPCPPPTPVVTADPVEVAA